jgi:serine/threonine protein kinase
LKGKGYGKAVDWWSFGSLIYEMLTGLPPFYSQDVQEMYRKIMTEEVRFPAYMSSNARDIVDKLLQRDLTQRLKDPSVIKQHPFFQNINYDQLVQKKIPPPFVPKVVSIYELTGTIS